MQELGFFVYMDEQEKKQKQARLLEDRRLQLENLREIQSKPAPLARTYTNKDLEEG